MIERNNSLIESLRFIASTLTILVIDGIMYINDIKTQSRGSSVPERFKVRGLANKSKLIIRFIFHYQIGW